MFEKILVPVDFSEHSRAALGHAALFASAFGSSLELVHVVEHVVHSHAPFWTRELLLGEELHAQALAAAEAAMQKLRPEVPVASPGAVETTVLSGTLPASLVDHAEQGGAGLIVVSTHGRTGFSRWLMGSVSERLLRMAHCPVLVARGGSAAAQPSIRRLLAAVDLSDHSRRALSVAGGIAQKLGATLEVLYVWAAPYYEEPLRDQAGLFERIREHARTELDEFVDGAGLPSSVPVERTIVSGTPTAEIQQRVQQTHADLLVLGTHGRGGVKRLVLGSVAESTARYATSATLVVR